jgi:hypothetical protein
VTLALGAASTPLSLFSILWATAAALHHLEAQPLAGLPIYPFVVLLILFPARIGAIAAFALAHITLLWFDLPAAANHSVLALLVDGTLLIGCLYAIWGRTDVPPARRLWETVQGPIRATVLAVYGLAVFHKLNSSFFDAQVSCATSQLAKMFGLHGFAERSTNFSAFAFNIYLTLAFEIAIIVFLAWPRFAYVGGLIGLIFHTGVAWARFFDFATVVFALYLFFLPWDGLQRAVTRLPRWATTGFAAGFIALTITSFYFHGIRHDADVFDWRAWTLKADTLICLFWTLMVWPLLLPVFLSRSVRTGAPRWSGAPLAWLVPAVALINGLTPYLGLKTVANYSMFSNLRTEGGQTNHFLMPAGQFFLAEYQLDLVRVEWVDRAEPDSYPLQVRLAGGSRWIRRNSRWLREAPEARVPFMELQRTLQLWQEVGFTRVSVMYQRQGVWHELEDAFSSPELMRPLSFWERKFMAFRAVQDDGQESVCRW